MSTDLVIIRPAPGAGRSARAAKREGFTPIVHSMFEAKPLRWEPPAPSLYDAIIASSANALRLGGPALAALQDLPVHAVGEATASAARALLRPHSHPVALSLARPFAARTFASAAAGPSDDGKLTPEQEHKKRIDMMFAEKTLREDIFPRFEENEKGKALARDRPELCSAGGI